jgi:CheY-like chemotaxis protein
MVNNKTILVVDDNELNLKLVRSLLHIENYRVLEAENAANGIQLAQQFQPDLILMDIQLPDMDGLQATKQILSDKNVKHIPIVAFSSYAMDGDKEKALAAGCVGYITKPIDNKSFSKTIAEHIQ